MSKRKPLDGKNLMLWLGNKVVALSKSCSLSIDIQIGDGNTKDDGLWDSGDIVGASWTMDNQSVDSADAAVGTDRAGRRADDRQRRFCHGRRCGR